MRLADAPIDREENQVQDPNQARPPGFAIGVRYLTGYAVAALPDGRAEWPPHPARLFMAMVAACHETGADPEELEALRWLEQQAEPDLIASDADARQAVTVYVPPNDFKNNDLNILPQFRTKKQPRTFARVRPHHDVVHFAWPSACPHTEAMGRLCDKVTRVGHSSSLVQVWLAEPEEAQNDADALTRYRADPTGTKQWRIVRAGALEYLSAQYREDDVRDHFRLHKAVTSARGKAKKQAQAEYEARLGRPWKASIDPPQRLRPTFSITARYRAVVDDSPFEKTCFDTNLIALRLTPQDSTYRRLDAVAAPRVCHVLRNAMISKAPNDLPIICGHEPDGGPLMSPHMAVMPLLSAVGPYADGHLIGVALAMPRLPVEHADDATKRSVHDRAVAEAMTAVHRVTELTLGDLGVWKLEAVPFDDTRQALQPSSWTALRVGVTQTHRSGCARWATVTPIAFDRHPKTKVNADPKRDPESYGKQREAYQRELLDIVSRACEAIGLPAPVDVRLSAVSAFAGLPDARRYPRLTRKDGSQRRQSHAVLRFGEPVLGPVLLGAGRYRGWGVCKPWTERGHDA